MENASLVVIYGVPHGQRRERRIGTGTLPLPKLVLVDERSEEQFLSAHPPVVRRVGIGSIKNGHPQVEVVEVRQVMRSSREFGASSWGLELVENAVSPTSFFTGSSSPPPDQLDARRLSELLRLRPSGPPVLGGGGSGTVTQDPPVASPASIWCLLFPQASFCH